MYKPFFNTSKTGVPILSAAGLERIGEEVLADFCPDALNNPTVIDVDRFLTNYLGLKQDFQYLSHCGLYLGMTVFQDCKIPVFDPIQWQAKAIAVEAGTVILDNCLLEENQEHRYRFTAVHEGSHDILHPGYFEKNAETYAAMGGFPAVQCSSANVRLSQRGSQRSDADWLEWQANRLGSILLMPREVTLAVAEQAERRSRCCNAGQAAVAEAFNVSVHAAYYRLKDLGFIKSSKH